jgi:hypothetical protein
MLDATGFFETLFRICQNTGHHIPEDSKLTLWVQKISKTLLRIACVFSPLIVSFQIGADPLTNVYIIINATVVICLSIYGSTILLLDLGRFFSFLILYAVGTTPWTADQPVARPLPTHRINAHGHLCLEWDSNSRSQRLTERRQFIP